MSNSLAQYYGDDNSAIPAPDIFEPAQTAFDQAVETFKQRSKRDSKERRQILQATSLQDVVDAVAMAHRRYEKEHTKSKARRCITEFSKRLCYYGNVMDVLVQHHPEYVALVWGAMKLIFSAIVEHENIGTAIITGLCDIADALPRVELAAFLYPTKAMKQTVPVLYAHIIKFLVRALEWYEEGKIARALHSITKPAALRYDDLIEDVRRAARSIADLALMSSQAEQRDMHDTLRALTSMIKQLKEEMVLNQSINSSALFECRNALSEIQLTQGLAVISSQCSIDYKSSLQTSLLIRDRHRLVSYRSRCTPFWTSPELHAWNTSQRSTLITIQANFKTRFYIRDFCSSVIEQLLNARLAVLWVLKASQDRHHSVSEILKSLLHQALSLDYVSHTDSAFSFQLRKFLDAHFENDYVDLLGSVLQHFKLVYIIVEAGAMEPAAASQCQNYLRELSHRLSERGAATVVKCLTLSYGPTSQIPQPKDSIVLKVGKTSRRKGKKLPSHPLRSEVDIRRQQMSNGRMSRGLPFHTRRRAVRLADD